MVSSGGSDILVHFGDEDFLHRYQEFEQHLPEWKAQYPKLAAADMRYERQVVLEMQPGTGVPVKSDAGAARGCGGRGCGCQRLRGCGYSGSGSGYGTKGASEGGSEGSGEAGSSCCGACEGQAWRVLRVQFLLVKTRRAMAKSLLTWLQRRRAQEARAKQAAGAGER